jgi:hypothetical protein
MIEGSGEWRREDIHGNVSDMVTDSRVHAVWYQDPRRETRHTADPPAASPRCVVRHTPRFPGSSLYKRLIQRVTTVISYRPAPASGSRRTPGAWRVMRGPERGYFDRAPTSLDTISAGWGMMGELSQRITSFRRLGPADHVATSPSSSLVWASPLTEFTTSLSSFNIYLSIASLSPSRSPHFTASRTSSTA